MLFMTAATGSKGAWLGKKAQVPPTCNSHLLGGRDSHPAPTWTFRIPKPFQCPPHRAQHQHLGVFLPTISPTQGGPSLYFPLEVVEPEFAIKGHCRE